MSCAAGFYKASIEIIFCTTLSLSAKRVFHFWNYFGLFYKKFPGFLVPYKSSVTPD